MRRRATLLCIPLLLACSESEESPPASGSSGEAGGGSLGSGGETGSGGGAIFPDGVTAPRIMIVGDSISAGPGCYKKYLLQDGCAADGPQLVQRPEGHPAQGLTHELDGTP